MKPSGMEAGLAAALRRGLGFLPKPGIIRASIPPNFSTLMQVVKMSVSLDERQTVFAFADIAFEQRRETLGCSLL